MRPKNTIRVICLFASKAQITIDVDSTRASEMIENNKTFEHVIIPFVKPPKNVVQITFFTLMRDHEGLIAASLQFRLVEKCLKI